MSGMNVFGPMLAAMVVSGVIYGCGPNIVVGAVGVAVTGGLAIRDKVNKVFLESRLAENRTANERQILQGRIITLQENQDANLLLCKRFAISMIPFVGPLIAMA